MKLIALRDFRDVSGEIEVAGKLHPNHIHKGAIFSIGGDQPLEKMKKEDRELVARLNAAACIGDGNNAETVKVITAEAAAEKKKAEAEAKRLAALSAS